MEEPTIESYSMVDPRGLLFQEILALKSLIQELSNKVQTLEIRQPQPEVLPTWNTSPNLSDELGDFMFLEYDPGKLKSIYYFTYLLIYPSSFNFQL